MGQRYLILVILIFGFFVSINTVSGLLNTPGSPSDLILLNGSIYTVVPGTEWENLPVEAIAITGNRISYVGNISGATTSAGPQTQIIDLQGKMVLPGFFDTHVHYGAGALVFSGLNLTAYQTASQYQGAIRKYAKDNPDQKVIRGYGWIYSPFNPSGPDKSLIDEVVSDKPVFLTAFDGHSTWVNSKSLEIADITKDTPDPDGGRIERDGEGNPSGTLREMSAANLVGEKIPPISPEEIKSGLQKNVNRASGFGVTTAHEAGIMPALKDAFTHIESEGKLPVRIIGEILITPKSDQKLISSSIEDLRNYSSPYYNNDDIHEYLDTYLSTLNATEQELFLQKYNNITQEGIAPPSVLFEKYQTVFRWSG